MKKIREIKLAKKNYQIDWEYIPDEVRYNKRTKRKERTKVFGLCDNPKDKDRAITINIKQRPRDLINTCVHEVLHGIKWSKKESQVYLAADAITEFLWRIGLRFENTKRKYKTRRKTNIN